jgi:hypothetical protein
MLLTSPAIWLPESLASVLLLAASGKWGMYAGLFFASFVKFGLAAVAAMGNSKLNFVEIMLVVGGGALLSVPFYTFFGDQVRRLVQRYFKRRKPASFARRRRIYRIWHRYGIWGAAALTPFISPMVAVGLSVSFQETPRRIISIIGGGVLIWSLIFSFLREWVLVLLEMMPSL